MELALVLGGAFVLAALIWGWMFIAPPPRKHSRSPPNRTLVLYLSLAEVCMGTVILLNGLLSGELPRLGRGGSIRHDWLLYEDHKWKFFFEGFLFASMIFFGLKGLQVTLFTKPHENE
jgi:hypothetical protein